MVFSNCKTHNNINIMCRAVASRLFLQLEKHSRLCCMICTFHVDSILKEKYNKPKLVFVLYISFLFHFLYFFFQ